MVPSFSGSGTASMPEILSAAVHSANSIEVIARDPLEGAMDLPCTLTLEIPVMQFTVGALMRLSIGSIVATAIPQNEDLPLRVNGQLVGLVEIEVAGDNLAVRLTGIS